VNRQLPSREQALRLLKENNCSIHIINHCIAVTELSLDLAKKLQAKGLKIDLTLIEVGAMLHDLGRSETHTVNHSLVGVQIAKKIGLPDSVVNIIKRHVGAGISCDEADWLGWPKDNYIPQTLEEKIVCYADKLIDHDRVMPVEVEIEKLQKNEMFEAAERVRKLHEEIRDLLGEEI
jgi:uncharacterized protein